MIFVGKVDSIDHAKNVAAKSKKLKVSTRVVTHLAELLSSTWRSKYGTTDTSLPTWDDHWADDHDDDNNSERGKVPRLILESVNECVSDESSETREVQEALGDQIIILKERKYQ